MAISEKFCLKWNDFQTNISTAFSCLRGDEDFNDVTLASDDGQQIEAHKVILASSSPFFQNLLKRNKHAHPLIYMRGIKSDDLVAIVDFIYHGETKISQENLDSFLNIADELSLKGLSGGNNGILDAETKDIEETTKANQASNIPKLLHKTEKQENYENDKLLESHTQDKVMPEVKTLEVTNPSFFGGLQDLDDRIKTMMIVTQNLTQDGKRKATACQVCGKEGYATQIQDHIVANHIEGVSIPCNICGKTFRSRNSLRVHKYNH